jgi:hypothetical protein
MKTELFIPQHLVALSEGNADLEHGNAAIISQMSGPAFTLMTDKDELLGCGGLRIRGVAQAWGYFSKDALEHKKLSILCQSRRMMNKMIAENRIFKTYADPEAGEVWFKHMGFVKQESVFVR